MIFHDPVSCIDTVEVILSDWRNTGTGTTQNLKTWLLSPPASWHDCTVRASCEFRDKERFVAFSLWGVVVNLWSTDHKMYFYQNACVCHRDEIFYWNVLSNGSLLLLVAFYISSQIWWLLDPSRFTLFPQFGTYTPLETSLLRFQSHGWAASVEWGAEVGAWVAAAAQVAAPPQSRPVATGQPEPSGDLPPKRASSGLTISHAGLGLTNWDGFHLSVIFLGVCEFSPNL